MTVYHAELAFHPDGTLGPAWIRVGDDGCFDSVSRAGSLADSIHVPGLVLPGIPNLHSHAFQRGLAGRAERSLQTTADSFWTWREAMYHFLAELGPDHVEAIAAQLYVEMLEAGYTRVVEFHYLHRDPAGNPYDDPAEMAHRLVRAAETAGIGLTLLPVIYDAGGFGGAPLGESQRRFRLDVAGAADMLTALGAVDRGLALHSLRGVAPHTLDAFLDDDSLWSGAPVHIHVAEQPREVEECVAWSGARPLQWLFDRAPVGSDWCLVHATHTDAEELADVARSGATVGLCPTTEANLGDGVFPLKEYMAQGGVWGIGSDSHVSVDPVEELRWLEYGQRITRLARNVVVDEAAASTASTLLSRALRGGAAAAGVRCGALESGCSADMVVLDLDSPLFAGHGPDTFLDAWIFSGNRRAVRDVMVGGKWMVEDGRHVAHGPTLRSFRSVMARL